MMPPWTDTLAAIVWTQPLWLIGLLLAIVPLLIVLRGRALRRLIPIGSVALQCLAVLVAVAALAGPRTSAGGRAKFAVLVAIDASGSVGRQHLRAERAIRDRLPADATVEQLYFAEGLGRTPPDARDATDPMSTFQMIAHRAGDGLSAAVIATDGRFTAPAWLEAASALAGIDADVFIVPLNAPPPDARVAGLTARRQGDSGVRLAAHVAANAPLERTLVIARRDATGWRELLRRKLALLPEAPASVRLTDALAPSASAEYVAHLVEPEAVGQNNVARAVVLPTDTRVAIVGATTPPDIKGAVVVPPGELDGPAHRLREYASIVLIDSTGQVLTPGQRRALADYVRGGGGLVLIGAGPHDEPADANDPLNRVAALRANPFERRPLHLKVLLDRSGSMGERTAPSADRPAQVRFDIAAEAVAGLRSHLTARDVLTVATFAGSAEVIYDSSPSGPDFAELRRRLVPVRPSGSTRVTPALAEALKTPTATGRRPMLLVLSDLETEAFDPGPWAAKLSDLGAHLAVVAVGRPTGTPTAATPLKRLVEALGDSGQYRRRARMSGLAEVFARLVRDGRGSIVKSGPVRSTIVGPLFGSTVRSLPDLDAWLLTASSEGAEVLVRAGPDPILARRQVGLGRSVSLAVPADAAWHAKPDVAGVLEAAVTWTLRPGNDPRFAAELTRQGDRLGIAVTARDAGGPINAATLTAAVDAGGEPATVELLQVAPGRYEGLAPCPPDRPAAVAVRDAPGATVWRGQAPALSPAEYRRLGADTDALRRLAEVTGGRVVSIEAIDAQLRRSRKDHMTPLAPWLLAAAAAMMLLEWALTRVTRH